MNSLQDQERPISNSYWVIPGKFAAGEYPGHKNDSEAREKLRSLLNAGIDHFIDLTDERDGLEPYAQMAREEAQILGITFDWEPHAVRDLSVPGREDMVMILDSIDDAVANDKTVYLHCWGGIGRTGTVVGCWLRRRGYSGEEALSQIAEWWKGVEKYRRRPESPETHEQRQYILNWNEP